MDGAPLTSNSSHMSSTSTNTTRMFWSARDFAATTKLTNICELAGFDALNPRLLLSLTTGEFVLRGVLFHPVVGLHGHVFRHVRFWIYGASRDSQEKFQQMTFRPTPKTKVLKGCGTLASVGRSSYLSSTADHHSSIPPLATLQRLVCAGASSDGGKWTITGLCVDWFVHSVVCVPVLGRLSLDSVASLLIVRLRSSCVHRRPGMMQRSLSPSLPSQLKP